MALSDLVSDIKSDLTIAGTRYDSDIERAVRSVLTMLRGQKYWFLYDTYDLTLVSGDTSESLPSGFSARGSAYIVYNGTRYTQGRGFDFMSYEEFKRKFYTIDPIPSGTPQAWSIKGDKIYFSHTADTDYTVTLEYYKQDATLPTNDGDDSIWFEEGYEYVRALTLLRFKQVTSGFAVQPEDEKAVMLAEEALNIQHGNREL